MPNIRLKSNGHVIVDPGGDPASSATQGGVQESNGAMAATNTTGWRQLLVDRGGATTPP